MFATKHQRRARLARLHRQRGASLLEAIAYPSPASQYSACCSGVISSATIGPE